MPKESSSAKSPAWLDAETPSTLTTAAIPMLIPRAESSARNRRERRPKLLTLSTSANAKRLFIARHSLAAGVAHDESVANLQLARHRRRDLGIVRDDHNGPD